MKKNEIKTSLHKKGIPTPATQINISSDEIKKIIKIIYDEKFIQLLNSLSTKIKTYYVNNESNISKVKKVINSSSLPQEIPELTNPLQQIGDTFESFYNDAKTIFKAMKTERNGRNEKLEALQKNNPLLRHFINQSIEVLDEKKPSAPNSASTPAIKNGNSSSNANNSIPNSGSNPSEINKIKYYNLKRENILLKQKVEILERCSSTTRRPSPRAKTLKIDSFSTNHLEDTPVNNTSSNINIGNKPNTSYSKISTKVNETITNNINSNLQNEQIKIKSDLYNFASVVNKFLINLRYLEKNSKSDNIAIIKSNIDKEKRNLNKLCLAFLTNMSLSSSAKNIEKSQSKGKTVSNFNINNNITIQNGGDGGNTEELKKLKDQIAQLNQEAIA